ncbi:hypothetical protein PMAYCL1PPCAC_22413, partial [Pristionchus mayeri]
LTTSNLRDAPQAAKPLVRRGNPDKIVKCSICGVMTRDFIDSPSDPTLRYQLLKRVCANIKNGSTLISKLRRGNNRL